MYITHKITARVVYLIKESCGQLALKHIQWSRCNSESESLLSGLKDLIIKQPGTCNDSGTPRYTLKCYNKFHFIVDFSLILPTAKVSTVWVYCAICGKVIETVLCDKTIQLVLEEVQNNIVRTVKEKEENCSDSFVMPIPLQANTIQGYCFVEGVTSVSPLTNVNHDKPPVFIRTRISYYCNTSSNILKLIHQSKK